MFLFIKIEDAFFHSKTHFLFIHFELRTHLILQIYFQNIIYSELNLMAVYYLQTAEISVAF